MQSTIEIKGIKITSDEGLEKIFSMIKNLNDFKILSNEESNIKEINNPVIDVDQIKRDYEEELESKQKEIYSLIQKNDILSKEIDEKEKVITDKNGEIKSLSTMIDTLSVMIDEKEKEILELKNKIVLKEKEKEKINIIIPKEPEIKETPEETKPIENTNTDFNPNNESDIAWLMNALSTPEVKVETPIEKPVIPEAPKDNDKEYINDSIYVKRDLNGDITQINEFVLEPREKQLLKMKVTTIENLLNTRTMMKNNDELNKMAHGWE